MTPADQQAIKQHIQATLAELTETIAGLQEMVKPIAPDSAIGRLTRMDAINTRGANERALQQAQLHEQQLQQALTRIDQDPNYGLCQECDEPIAPARLKLVPEALHCIECAT